MSLNVIIVEDELGAAKNLKLILRDLDPQINVLAILGSIQKTVEWLNMNQAPQLAFFDIQLEDGLSFDIFKEAEINFPVIFTTAFDQYAIEAFKVNSVDYLLKPIKEQELAFSLEKYRRLSKSNMNVDLANKILSSIHSAPRAMTFLVHFRDKLIPVSASDIAFFYIKEGLVHGCSHKNQIYPIDHSLDELEETLDNNQFFRANRQYIVNRGAIHEIEFFFNGRLSLSITPPAPETVLISKARVPVFKTWMKGNDLASSRM